FFDTERPGLLGLRGFDCEGNNPKYPFRALVKLYAKLGLHRYNLLEFFNMKIGGGASSYYITLAGCAPDSDLQQSFQVIVAEERLGLLDVKVSMPRPRGEDEDEDEDVVEVVLPDWPSETDFSDRKRFRMLKESELRSNDWITLYLELALAAHDRTLTDLDLLELEIVQVAIEDVETPRKGAKTAVYYISYKDVAKARKGEPVDRKAVVRRVLDEPSGELALVGEEIALVGEEEEISGELETYC
ncbi:unnamed protein product, partial [Thlaspi arvense]